MRKKKGFTLAELLIVVAIIGVLVAISIPIFTGQLRKARKATNWANMRAAYAAVVAEYLGEENPGDTFTRYYHVDNGIADSDNSGMNMPDGDNDEDYFEKKVVHHFMVTLEETEDGINVTMYPGYNNAEFSWMAKGDISKAFPEVETNG